MKKTKTIPILIVFSLLVFSFITPLTLGADAMPYLIDHNYGEEYWSILFDVAGWELEHDYGPEGIYAGTSTGSDLNTDIDSKFYMAYTNVGNVQSLYIAMQNFSWGLDSGYDKNNYGCAPFQVLSQHFSPPGTPGKHIFVINRFFGLLAYLDNKTDGDDGLPSANDELFMGWSFYSEYHKNMVNQEMQGIVPDYMLIDNDTTTTAIPIQNVKTTSGDTTTYEYGMSYQNLFVLWQRLDVDQGLNETTTSLSGVVGLSIIEELNFTYQTTVTATSATYSTVTTTTEYDIGNMTELWVIGNDDNTLATSLGGNHVLLPGSVDLAYYNWTNNALPNRLNGSDTYGIPGFSLGVVNTVNIMTMDFSKTDASQAIQSGVALANALGVPLGSTTQGINKAIYNDTTPIYEIDFASKPTYKLNGVDGYNAPTQVINKSLFHTNLEFGTALAFAAFVIGLIGNATGLGPIAAAVFAAYMLAQGFVDQTSFYYVTCFPDWAGGTINQDPTFTAYANIPSSTNIPGFEPIFISIAGLMGLSYVVMRTRKKKRLKIS